jgi:two-component system chemotaxis sensor kinase CheA
MASDNSNPLLEIFIFETNQLLEQVEEIMLSSERANALSPENINEIFRAMHTIKGSAAMMEYDGISQLAHAVEDMFYFVRENKNASVAYSDVCDFVLQASDFIKNEIAKIVNGMPPDGDPEELSGRIHGYLDMLKSGGRPALQKACAPEPAEAPEECAKPLQEEIQALENGIFRYTAHVAFDENCQMENIRAFGLIHNMKDLCIELAYRPDDLLDNDATADVIAREGFSLTFTSKEDRSRFEHLFDQTMFLKFFTLAAEGEPASAAAAETAPAAAEAPAPAPQAQDPKAQAPQEQAAAGQEEPAQEDAAALHEDQEKKENLLKSVKQSQISVNISKLDSLMDLVGEIVINEAMVTHNPDLKGLQLDNFQKAARQLRKLTDELQDLVMSVRMIPVANTFHKMTRIVRDMGKRLDKEADLSILGEETEVDKNIIDNLSDPLMHLIRNAMDHGLESREERLAAGKPEEGRITLEAVNTGGDVLITVSDDGRGLNREKILQRAREQDLLPKAEADMTDRDVFSLVLLPGFSTKEEVTEYSGRGVGMDVVRKNIEKVGGSVSIESAEGQGTTVTIKIPLTLAIIDGMMFSVGKSVFTVSTNSIREVFRPSDEAVVTDTDGHEMIMVRGQCLPVIRLHNVYDVETEVTDLKEGILLEVESDDHTVCIFADRLMGEQQVVVKPLPYYLVRFGVKDRAGIGGCTILGDGSISLILDTAEIMRCFM